MKNLSIRAYLKRHTHLPNTHTHSTQGFSYNASHSNSTHGCGLIERKPSRDMEGPAEALAVPIAVGASSSGSAGLSDPLWNDGSLNAAENPGSDSAPIIAEQQKEQSRSPPPVLEEDVMAREEDAEESNISSSPKSSQGTPYPPSSQEQQSQDQQTDDAGAEQELDTSLSRREARRLKMLLEKDQKAAEGALKQQLQAVLNKSEDDRSQEEISLLALHPDAVKRMQAQSRRRDLAASRQVEALDTDEELQRKVDALAAMMTSARHTVIYTGAGISTSCGIPDYRGPNGLRTIAEKQATAVCHAVDLSSCSPTFTHHAITALVEQNRLQHVVSQNCDGLHLRSGLPRSKISEIHGNTNIEFCPACKAEYVRPFDVTNASRYRYHKTGRSCERCSADLNDTIVYFGETGKADSVHQWGPALNAAKETELIICIGTSLKVLKKYDIWGGSRGRRKPALVIVNLQWTPKDRHADLVIKADSDRVMRLLVDKLGVQVQPRPDPFLSLERRSPDLQQEQEGQQQLVALRSVKCEAEGEEPPRARPRLASATADPTQDLKTTLAAAAMNTGTGDDEVEDEGFSMAGLGDGHLSFTDISNNSLNNNSFNSNSMRPRAGEASVPGWLRVAKRRNGVTDK
eukprot:m.131078 g.131078  ORF g.131078 m.131078 type:complete len:630 (+) comp16449_c0_seq3:222-2111(+)